MHTVSLDRVLAEVDRARDEIIDFAARLVRIPTINPPGDEYETCAALIGDQLRAHGAEVHLLPATGRVEHTPYLRVFMASLRQKLEDDPAQPRLIITETGIGYRLMAASESVSEP